MYVDTKFGRIHRPTDEEDEKINLGIAADPDTFVPTDEEFKKFKPMGRPKASITKERINIRLSREVVESFRATGRGWQTRIDEILKEWLKNHST